MVCIIDFFFFVVLEVEVRDEGVVWSGFGENIFFGFFDVFFCGFFWVCVLGERVRSFFSLFYEIFRF